MLRRGSTALLGPAALTVVLAGCTSATDAEPAAQESAVTGPVVTATVTATVTAPVAPEPATTDPAAPDPAAPDPAAPDPVPGPLPTPPGTAAAVRPPSATAAACEAVEEALADAVVRYEVEALAEDGLGGGDRTAAWTDMGEALDRAAREAGAAPGLADAAAPALAEIAALRDGMAARPALDEDDAQPWRDARNRLEAWCDDRD